MLKVCTHKRERTRADTGYGERSEKVMRGGGGNRERADVTVRTPVPCARARAGAELASECCARSGVSASLAYQLMRQKDTYVPLSRRCALNELAFFAPAPDSSLAFFSRPNALAVQPRF